MASVKNRKAGGRLIALTAFLAASVLLKPAAVAVLFLLPFITACCAAQTGVKALGLPVTVIAVIAGLYGTPLMFPGLLLFALALALAVVSDTKTRRPFHARLALCFAALLMGPAAFFPWLIGRFGTDIITGVSEAAVHLADMSPMRDELLIRLYQYGIIGMTPKMLSFQRITSSLGLAGSVLLPDTRQELLLSLLTTLKLMIPTVLPTLWVLYAGIGAAVMAMLPVRYRRKNGLAEDEPAEFTSWHLSGGMVWLAWLLVLGFVIPWFTADRTCLMVAVMMKTLFKILLVSQGLAAMAFWQKKAGRTRTQRYTFMAMLTILIYQVPMAVGIMDHITDRRGFRPKKEEDPQ